MIKVGRLITPVHQELSYAHCLQLAILEVLYNKKESDEEDDDKYSKEDYSDNDDLVRKIVKYLNKPTNNEQFQEFVKPFNNGKELKLILDNQTRWTSLYLMLERFIYLFPPVCQILRKL